MKYSQRSGKIYNDLMKRLIKMRVGGGGGLHTPLSQRVSSGRMMMTMIWVTRVDESTHFPPSMTQIFQMDHS
jgi:hypothetical protein